LHSLQQRAPAFAKGAGLLPYSFSHLRLQNTQVGRAFGPDFIIVVMCVCWFVLTDVGIFVDLQGKDKRFF
jgi:hypothetical protein